jgi:hypothetical protein
MVKIQSFARKTARLSGFCAESGLLRRAFFVDDSGFAVPKNQFVVNDLWICGKPFIISGIPIPNIC